MATTHKIIIFNLSYLTISKIISIILGFAYTIYVARYLGADYYGILSFALAISMIFRVFVNFGFDPFIIREVARNEKAAKYYFGDTVTLKLILGVISFFVVIIISIISNYPQIVRIVIYIIMLSTLIGAINNIFIDIYKYVLTVRSLAIYHKWYIIKLWK